MSFRTKATSKLINYNVSVNIAFSRFILIKNNCSSLDHLNM